MSGLKRSRSLADLSPADLYPERRCQSRHQPAAYYQLGWNMCELHATPVDDRAHHCHENTPKAQRQQQEAANDTSALLAAPRTA